jgi:hypothetical protein
MLDKLSGLGNLVVACIPVLAISLAALAQAVHAV